jgi:predicted AlkP superfamily pyrophosphatase or phosphodiesterase
MFTLDPAFVRPSYDQNCFTAIPASIAPLLGAPGVAALPDGFLPGRPRAFRTVVVILLDGFGWRFFEKIADDYLALRRFAAASGVAKLTSQFPSTTAAHITCLHTGLEVGQSGVYEWQYYEPELDAVITPLLFSYAGTKERDQLKATGIDARRLYPSPTLYQQLAKQGIASYVLAHGEYTPSTYSDIVYAGATPVGYRTLPEALVNLRLLLAEQRKPTYYVLYFDRLDALCHEYGPNAPQVDAELDTFLTTLERQLLGQLDGGRGDTLVLLTADHGQSETHPLRTIYLNTHPDFAGFERFLKTDRQGKPLVPAGSPRDFFLYVRDELVEEAHDFLARRLVGRAVVYRTADLIAAGFFGAAPVSEAFLGRVGNLIVLPYRREAVWWYEKDRFEQKYYGHHGGLTPQEMEIPLLAWAT